MVKNILVISGSPKNDGNTATLINWFIEGARAKGAQVELIQAVLLNFKPAVQPYNFSKALLSRFKPQP